MTRRSTNWISSRTGWVLVAALAVAVTLTPPSEAGQPNISPSPAAGHPLQPIVVTGTGFGAGETVDVSFNRLMSARVVAGPDGSFVARTHVPRAAAPGAATVAAEGEESGARARAPFMVRTNWPMLGGGAARAAYNPFENVLSTSNVSELHKAWTTPVGTSESSPAVVDGVLYVGAYYNDSFYALDASTGVVLWRSPTGSPVDSSPAVANGVVYFVSYFGDVFALDADTGAQLWTAPIGNSSVSSPVVQNGVLYVGGGDDLNLYALDASTGVVLWSFTTAGYVGAPAVADGAVYVGSSDQILYALDAATGTELWRFASGGPLYSAPVVADGVVYVGPSAPHVYALDAATGTQLWSFHTGVSQDGGGSHSGLANGVLYVGSGDDHVYALDAATGDMLWRVATGGFRRFPTAPAVANGVVYFGVWSAGGLYALDAATGAQLLRFAHVKTVGAAPVVDDGVVYVASDSGTLWALDLTGPAGPNGSGLTRRGGGADAIG